ncbi:MAG: AsnC family transcriptional regulator [Euryarchaeota archaeon]|nr:AsnC family transcriptional regulator [Euryarchaeota archaeon]
MNKLVVSGCKDWRRYERQEQYFHDNPPVTFSMDLDGTDRAIIKCLESDARMSLRSVAEEIGVSLGTVSNRLRRLESSGVVTGYTIRLDAEKAGWGLTVVVGLRIEKGRLLELQRRIAEDHRVLGVYDVTGDFDSMVVARAVDRGDLDDLSKTVLSLDGITRSVTHFVLNTVKEKSSSIPEH